MRDNRSSSIFHDLLLDPVFWAPPAVTAGLFLLVWVLSRIVFSIGIKTELYRTIPQDSMNFIMISLTSLAILVGLQQLGDKKFAEDDNKNSNSFLARLKDLTSQNWYPKIYTPFVYLSMYSMISYIFSRILSYILIGKEGEYTHLISLVGKIVKIITVYSYVVSVEYLIIVIGLWLLIIIGLVMKRDKSDPYSTEPNTDIGIVSGGYSGISKEQ